MSIIINPGTGDFDGDEAEAAANLAAFAADLAETVGGVVGTERVDKLDGGGWFGWRASTPNGGTVDVLMPGCPLGEVQTDDVLRARRVYVDGSSWYWGFALDAVADKLAEGGTGTGQWTLELVEAVAWSLLDEDLSSCPHYANGGMGCGQCVTEPRCITDQPLDGWPGRVVRGRWPHLLSGDPDDELSDDMRVTAVQVLMAIEAEGWRLVPPGGGGGES